VAHPSRVITLQRASMSARQALALGAAVLLVVGCASAGTVGQSPAPMGSSSPVGSQTATGSAAANGSPCMNPDPGTPSPVRPAVPDMSADSTIAASWSLDHAITVAPANGAAPVISRQRALCTLLAAEDIRGSDLVDDDSGLTLILGKVTISDALLAAPLQDADTTDLEPPPLAAFHSRLAWIAVVDPPIRAACPATQQPISSSGPPGDVEASATVSSPPVVPPYQLVVLDAVTGTDGLVYAARTNNPCASGALYGPDVDTLMLTVSVPWRLISRDPGGLFDTIALTVRTCDDFGDGAYATAAGVVEFEVSRPVAKCGTSKESDQTLQGPAIGALVATTLTHAATGLDDTTPSPQPEPEPSTTVSADAMLCAEAFAEGPDAAAVAASYPVSVDDLLRVSGGPPPGIHPFAVPLAAFPANDEAAWCEVKTSNGYLISAVTPDGAPLVGVQQTGSTFQPFPAGIPALP
jgi:hypothetical protein